MNQLCDFINKETRGFITKKRLQLTDDQDYIDELKESCITDNKIKHQLTIEERLAVIKARLIEKHSLRKIRADFKISSSLVYSILNSYKEIGISKLVAKIKEKSLLNKKEFSCTNNKKVC